MKKYIMILAVLASCFVAMPSVGANNTSEDNFESAEHGLRTIVTQKVGELKGLLGSEINEVDSLKVMGPVNNVDIHTMWEASHYGNLIYLDIKDARVESKMIPAHAFFPEEEGYPYTKLQHIILPDGITEIGSRAFLNAMSLVDVDFPVGLKIIREGAFTSCQSLGINSLRLPEGLKIIESDAFGDTKNVTTVYLPSTIKEIHSNAFSFSGLNDIDFPEGLEKIGSGAFMSSRISKAILPNSCTELEDGHQFNGCWKLDSIRIPSGLKKIPDGFAVGTHLNNLTVPGSVESIGNYSFRCSGLKTLTIEYGVEKIGEFAFEQCDSIRIISLPSSLKELGASSLANLPSLEIIYSPLADPINNGSVSESAFIYDDPYFDYADTNPDAVIYVPVGSAERYRKSQMWSYFSNFVETDIFPTSGIKIAPNIDGDESGRDMYDLSGNRILQPNFNQPYVRGGKKYLPRVDKEY